MKKIVVKLSLIALAGLGLSSCFSTYKIQPASEEPVVIEQPGDMAAPADKPAAY